MIRVVYAESDYLTKLHKSSKILICILSIVLVFACNIFIFINLHVSEVVMEEEI